MKDLREIHEDCYRIFKKGFFETFNDGDGEEFVGISKACKVYDKLIEDGGRSDCIGENFNQLIHRIEEEWFQNYTPSSSNNLDYYFFNYFLLLYLFVERVDLIFQVINKDRKSKLFNDYYFNNFKTLRKISKWANFIKHPKEFLFTHWPMYFIEGVQVIQLDQGDIKIDTDFIFEHYQNDKRPSPIVLENNDKVYVEVPNLENTTSEFCREMNVFFDFICSNQIVADYLKEKSTIESYFEFEEEQTEE